MGLSNSIRNFFYAATHANKLISQNQELQKKLTENDQTLAAQRNVINSMKAAYARLLKEKTALDQRLSLIDLHKPLPNMPIQPPVGRVDYLSTTGVVCESLEYFSAAGLIEAIKDDNFHGVPLSITIYSDPSTGSHMDTSWLSELDPPPQGFQISPYDAVANLTIHFTREELVQEVGQRITPRVAIECTAQYSDPSFYRGVVDEKPADKYRVVTSSGQGCCITPITRPLDSYEAALEGLQDNPTIRFVPYEELVQEVRERRSVGNPIYNLDHYSTEHLRAAIVQLDLAAAIEPQAPTPIPEFEFE